MCQKITKIQVALYLNIDKDILLYKVVSFTVKFL